MSTAQSIYEEAKKRNNQAREIKKGFDDYIQNKKNNTQRINMGNALGKYNTANDEWNNKKNQGYSPSDSVNNALNNSNKWADKINGMGDFEYKPQYEGKIKDLLSQYENNKFSYNINDDPLYQQLAENFQQKGKQAMADTMGQASAMTGGYGSSYSASVGQQAYQQNLNELNSVAPDLQQMAYSQYSDKQNQTLNMAGFYSDMDKGNYEMASGTYNTNMNTYKGMLDHYQSQYQYMDSAEREQYSTQLDAAYKSMLQAYEEYNGAQSQDNFETNLKAEQTKMEMEQANYDNDVIWRAAQAAAEQANKDRDYDLNKSNADRDYTQRLTEYTNAQKKVRAEQAAVKATKTDNAEKFVDEMPDTEKYSQYMSPHHNSDGTISANYEEYILKKLEDGKYSAGEVVYICQRLGISN